ncbi:dehydrogenase E1 component subunit alpha/beta [Horticoccus sp. 23ND18S-11]|uniref:dehydrogenase E1 component subunit alpha/beta n=1 Tax=Horticoccus sp. 23ND18S-11 TaxID=3391832 RepID=UPI0039C96455
MQSKTQSNLDSLFEQAFLIRGVERRLLDLFSQGKLFGTVHTCIGQEFSGVTVAAALEPGDLVFSNHRCHGHFIARTGRVEGLIAEVMGKNTGVCGGRGGSQHLCADGFYSNGIQGGIVPVAAGLAYALKVEQGNRIAVVFIGDGTLGEGALYETLNIASKWNLPLLVVLENNRYSQSTSQSETLAGDILARASCFGISTSEGNTDDPAALAEVARSAVESVRTNSRPHFLSISTARLMAHSKGDDLRDETELAAYWEKDALSVFERTNPKPAKEMLDRISSRIDTAVDVAGYAHPATVRAEDEDPNAFRPVTWTKVEKLATDRHVALLASALGRNMKKDERIVILGEDIRSPYGGAFKATRGLSNEFPQRVHNTPISEAAILGLGNGMALKGLLPVVEIMFGDFLFLAGDQLANHAAKFRYMYNDQVTTPVIVRTPMGGKRGYGPTHSQSIEKHFAGIPGTQMLALNPRQDPALVYDRLFAEIDRPTVVIENKLIYGMRPSEPLPTGYSLEYDDDRFPGVRFSPRTTADLSVFCYGGTLPDVEKAIDKLFSEHEVICDVICPVQIYPFNAWPIIESVRQTGRLLIVEEGVSFAGIGAEVISLVAEKIPGQLRATGRLGSRRHAIPSSGLLEKETLPNPESIIQSALALIRNSS